MRFVVSRRALLLFSALGLLALVSAPWGPMLPRLALLLGLLLLAAMVWQAARRPAEAALVLERRLPNRLSLGEPAPVMLTLHSRADGPLEVLLVEGCPAALAPDRVAFSVLLPPRESVELRYEVTPARRGTVAFAPALLRVGRPGALVEHLVSLQSADQARVVPGLRGLERHRLRARRDLMHLGGARRTRTLGRDGDFDRLRDHVAGDDLRHVDWKATARMRRPITRVWQAEKAQNLILLVDGTRLMGTQAGDRTRLDHALQAALVLAWAGLSAGDRVGVLVFDAGVRAYLPPDGGLARFARIVDLLHDQQATEQFPGYREAARATLRLVRRRSLLVWITDLLDAEQGADLLGALVGLRRRHLSVVVALDDPTVRAQAASVPTDEASLFVRVGAAEALEERAALLLRLRNAGAHVLDEPADRLPPELVDRYLDIKLRGLV